VRCRYGKAELCPEWQQNCIYGAAGRYFPGKVDFLPACGSGGIIIFSLIVKAMAGKKNKVETVRPTLEIDESLPLHEKGWVIQRVGWVIIISTVIAGILGLFGEGPLSKQSPVSGNIKATYERYFRFEAEMKIIVESASDHVSQISLPQAYLKNFKLLRFVPEPHHNTTAAGEVIYEFLPGQNRIVAIYLTPTNHGQIDGDMKVNGTNVFSLHHFIYP
jgi:hypothetical protein